MGEEEIRQKYLELQMGAEQMKQMQTQLQTVEAKSQELHANIESFDELKGQKDTGILTPIAEGIFLKAELKSDSHVIVNVGAGVCVKKTIEGAKKMLRERHLELENYSKEIISEVEKLAAGMKGLEEQLGSMIKQDKNV